MYSRRRTITLGIFSHFSAFTSQKSVVPEMKPGLEISVKPPLLFSRVAVILRNYQCRLLNTEKINDVNILNIVLHKNLLGRKWKGVQATIFFSSHTKPISIIIEVSAFCVIV